MKPFFIYFLALILISCSEDNKAYESEDSSFKAIDYLSRTNENVNGGTQYVYLSSGISEENLSFCFCQLGCNKSSETFYLLEYNELTRIIRFKKTPSEDFTNFDTSDWCIKYQ